MDPTDLALYAAHDIGSPPRYFGVPSRSQSGRMIWVGTEWCVTADGGVEKRNGAFRIPVSRLWDGEGAIGWVRRMGAIDEVTDLEDFAEGLRLARGVACGRLNRAELRPTFAAAG